MKRLLAAIILSSFVSLCFAANSFESEKKEFISAFNTGSYPEIKSMLGALQWKGISDEKVFDALLKQYNIFKDDLSKAGIKKTAYIARGLATSGNDKYKSIIQENLDNTSNRHLKKYYKRALSEFEYYARINPVISKGLDSAKNIDTQRVKNMLSAEDTDIVTIGAKRVYNRHSDNNQLLKATEARLLGIYKNELSKQEVQTAAYLAKALARSGQYRPLLTEVSNTAPNKKLRKYVKKYLKQM